jgi:hypothetical protein
MVIKTIKQWIKKGKGLKKKKYQVLKYGTIPLDTGD